MGVAVWRDISLIWLLSLTIISVLPFAVLFFYVIKGMRRLRQVAEKWLPFAGEKVEMVAEKTEEYSVKAAEPIIAVYAAAARVRGMAKHILER
jgi:hypothetical protein